MKSPIEIYLTFDLETTGLVAGKHAVCEIAACAMDSELNDISEYSSGVIKPYGEYEISDDALKVNKISRKMLENGRDSKEVVAEFIKYIKSFKKTASKIILCGHNIDKFDIPHLVDFFEFNKKDLTKVVSDKHTFDTMWRARERWLELPNFKLSTCCAEAGITLIDGHRALNDTRANKDLVRFLMKATRNEGVSVEVEEQKERVKFEF